MDEQSDKSHCIVMSPTLRILHSDLRFKWSDELLSKTGNSGLITSDEDETEGEIHTGRS